MAPVGPRRWASDRSPGDTERASIPILGDMLMVFVGVVAAFLLIAVALTLLGVLGSDSGLGSVEFEYLSGTEDNYTDSFGRTNADREYDGILQINPKKGPGIEAEKLYVRGGASLDGPQPWTATVDGGDGPAYEAGEEISAGNVLTLWVNADDRVEVFVREEGETIEVGTWEQ